MSHSKDPEELILTKRALAFQQVEIEILTAEIISLKRDFIFQNEEKQKRAEELTFANKELAFQNEEKHNRADELFIANKELAFQNQEKQNRADELFIANKELAFQKEEKVKRAEELAIANKELKKTEEDLMGYIKGLEEMIFITSHKVRQPIAYILGVSNLLNTKTNYSLDELKKIVDHMKKSATTLDDFTRELTTFMTDLKIKIKN